MDLLPFQLLGRAYSPPLPCAPDRVRPPRSSGLLPVPHSMGGRAYSSLYGPQRPADGLSGRAWSLTSRRAGAIERLLRGFGDFLIFNICGGLPVRRFPTLLTALPVARPCTWPHTPSLTHRLLPSPAYRINAPSRGPLPSQGRACHMCSGRRVITAPRTGIPWPSSRLFPSCTP